MSVTSKRATLSADESPPTAAALKFPGVDRFIKSTKFESLMGLVIVCNCMTIGMEVDSLVDDWGSTVQGFLQGMEHFFTIAFLAEFWLRFFFMGWRSFIPDKNGPVPISDALWNIVDACVVWITGVLFVWILQPLGVGSKVLRVFTAFRAVRLLRLIRIAKRVPFFHDVLVLMRGLAGSGHILFWTIIVMVFVTYIFAIFGVVSISTAIKEALDGASDEDAMVLSELHAALGGVDNMMYTLVQVLTLDSWNGIARPLLVYMSWSWVFFYAYIAVAVIVCMNLVTAIIVENALASSKQDEEQMVAIKEHQRSLALRKFKHIFELMDGDDDGLLSFEEFTEAFEKPDVATQISLLDFKREECAHLFELLDEGDGSLTLDEFFDGLEHMKGHAQAKDVFMVMKRLEQVWHLLSQVNDNQEHLGLTFGVNMKHDKRLSAHGHGHGHGHHGHEEKEKSEGGSGDHLREVGRHDSARSDSKAAASWDPVTFSHNAALAREHKQPRSLPDIHLHLNGRLDQILASVEGFREDVGNKIEGLATRLDRVEASTGNISQVVAELAAERQAKPPPVKAFEVKMTAKRGQHVESPCEMLLGGKKPAESSRV